MPTDRTPDDSADGDEAQPTPTRSDAPARVERVAGDDRLVPQPIADGAACPQCGEPATDESIQKHRLSDLGYVHDDQFFQCADPECAFEWVHGVPIHPAGYDPAADDYLRCPACEQARLLVHRVKQADRQTGELTLHLKCPVCYLFTLERRQPDEAGICLVGYPETTGDRSNVPPWGYAPEQS